MKKQILNYALSFILIATLFGAFMFWNNSQMTEKSLKQINGQIEQTKSNCSSLMALIQSAYLAEVNTSSLSAVLNSLTKSGELKLVQYTPIAFDPTDNSFKNITTNAISLDECSYYEELAVSCQATFTYTSLKKAVKLLKTVMVPISSFTVNFEEKSIYLTIALVPKTTSSQGVGEQLGNPLDLESTEPNNVIDLGGE